ncbi:protein-export chaperone SecB [Asticcacaulis sp. 201]|uniref:protein-export chaperone SecB n=1 Tax=Asticcacaulis sp. 201 TaxID=3028787 RepID=UPI002915F819|nr:protein-export chaperone SecB [Asticcacaulis sp. 201]MDV6331135.1 protein-export chaperone SecB [Asticcacaulis sp. 201]
MTQEFSIRRLYVKDISFEAPGGAHTFTKAWDPEIKVDVDVSKEQLGETTHDVTLILTVVVRNAGEVAFMLEVLQAGIFHVTGYDGEMLHRILHTVCPNALFPYAREAIDNIVIKGSFPPLMLEPVNFEAIYLDNKA